MEHKYDKLFRFFSLKLIPSNVVLPSFFEKKIYFYPSDILALALLFIALFALRTPLNRFFLSKGAIFLWTVFLFTFISIVLSPLAHYPIPYIRLWQLATPFLLFCFLANVSYTEEEKTRLSPLLLKCLVLAALIQSGIAIAQYATQGPLGLRLIGEPNNFASFTASSGRHWIFDSGISKVLLVIRPSGTFPHPNVLGGFLSISILATYSLFFTPRWKWLSAMLIPVQFFAMVLTFSRSALFSWILGTFIWFALHVKKNGFRSTANQSLLLGSICVSILFSSLVLYEQISDRGGIVNYNAMAQGSDSLRISYQNIALKILQDHPLYGAGFQQLSLCALDYTNNDPKYPVSGATHNIYLYLAAETGLFSLAAFLLFICSLLWAAIKAPYTPLLGSLTAMFVAFLFIGICDFYPLLFQQGKLPFFLAAGLLASNTRKQEVLTFKAAA